MYEDHREENIIRLYTICILDYSEIRSLKRVCELRGDQVLDTKMLCLGDYSQFLRNCA